MTTTRYYIEALAHLPVEAGEQTTKKNELVTAALDNAIAEEGLKAIQIQAAVEEFEAEIKKREAQSSTIVPFGERH